MIAVGRALTRMIAARRGWADVGDVKAESRKRAVGTRDRVMSYLVAVGELRDASGMASTALAEAIAYPGSSIAFAQLLSGMERSGLIEREVRGKRTYRIAPAQDAAAQIAAAQAAAAARPGTARSARRQATVVASGPPVAAGRGGQRAVLAGPEAGDGRGLVAAAKGAEDFDYDELARRLLVQVVQRLAASPGEGPQAGAAVEPAGAGQDDAALARTVASLEHKLASVRSRQRRLTEENAKLREQLRAAQESLALAQDHTADSRTTGQLDSAEVSLLERLLSPLRERGDRREEAGAG
jgi:hypothetical protein